MLRGWLAIPEINVKSAARIAAKVPAPERPA
jgi:hypothetical protein